ncbi:MAG: hypothetical protein KJ799_13410 [Bacteroidetes bacterium]|nr:hypothetical protein [Bacteroidota bacterium]MBU2507704.1 hypothetical protein [Bacteroidota bacterium]
MDSIIVFFVFIVAIIGGILLIVMWMDKKIDTKERLGYSAHKKKNSKI